MFYLPKPRPLDHLVGTLFAGPTLVLNGALDPLQKAVERAEVITPSMSCVYGVLTQGVKHCCVKEPGKASASCLKRW